MKKVAFVVPPGLEPGLFCTKNRRVANYTMGQFHNVLNLNGALCGLKCSNKIQFHKTKIKKIQEYFILQCS